MSLIQLSSDGSNAISLTLSSRGIMMRDLWARAWRVDETSIRVKGRWTALSRAVDKQCPTVDFLLRECRNIAAAKQFFTQAIKQHGPLAKITVDGYPATQTAISELKAEAVLPHSTQVLNKVCPSSKTP